VYPAAINNLGEIAGDYFDADFNIHNFVLTRGVFTPIDVPGSAPGSVGVRGINDRGQVVGYALDADFNYVSFLATPSH
jgi:probable HAF family extracellular repeat protein